MIVIINVSSNNNQHENESRANGHCHFVNDDSFSFLATYPIFDSEDYLNIETSAIFIEVPFFCSSDYVIAPLNLAVSH